jgi:tetratricopeptide (TPR) repeat protein
LCIVFSVITTSAQTLGELEVFGRLEQSYQPVGNGEIRIVQNGNIINNTRSNSRGRFSFSLSLEDEFIVEFTAPGLVTKRLLFDTKLEGRRLRRNYFEFDLVIDLFQEIDGIDFSFFEEPLATIGFIDEVNKFFFREADASPRLRRANEIHLQVVDLIRRRESYATSIQQADQYFQGQSYQLARDAYAQASGFLPEETYPKTRIEEIDQILAQRNELDRQYNNLITEADREFTAGMLRESREKYLHASEMKPAQEYPRQRISEIDRTLAQDQERQMQYNRLIRLADESFAAQNYEAARPHYESAVTIRPAESYPAERIREIDRILATCTRIEREYNTHISRGDSEFAQGRLEQSKQSYLSALEVKPSETYPRNRIEEIDRLVAERDS